MKIGDRVKIKQNAKTISTLASNQAGMTGLIIQQSGNYDWYLVKIDIYENWWSEKYLEMEDIQRHQMLELESVL